MPARGTTGHWISRRHLLGAAVAGAASRGSQAGGADAPLEARLIVRDGDQGLAIAPDFVGLSYEASVLESADYFNPANRSVVGLLRTLASPGVLRVGANASERTFWQSSEASRPPSDAYVLRPPAIDKLAAFLAEIDWRLIWGLNLARSTPEQAADEAQYVARALGPRLLAFQLGNEPDLFSHFGARGRDYDVSAYLREMRALWAAVRARVPQAPLAGPAIASEASWVSAFAQAAPDGLVLLTRHYYGDGPARAPYVSMERLFASAPNAKAMLADIEATARAHGLPYRLGETNSIFAEGHPGVSDAFGVALWGLELMFQCVEAGAAGINFHTGDPKFYTPIGPGQDGRHSTRALYYGMLMFAQACRGGGALLAARLDPTDKELVAYAVRTSGDGLRLCLINKSFARPARVHVARGGQVGRATVLRLAAPSADAKDGITFGGGTVDDFGAWSPTVVETLPDAGDLVVEVAAASAALVELRRG
jgi:glycosyl hydrolase family 79